MAKVYLVHIHRVTFEKIDKNLLDDQEYPDVRTKEYSGDFAFTDEDESMRFVTELTGGVPTVFSKWEEFVDDAGDHWFVYCEEPYELDPENPTLSEY